jgi:hypothetical protein
MKNVGSIDKFVRIVLGIALLSMFFLLESGMKYVGLLGIVLIMTGLFNFCGLYKIFGINTCTVNEKK